MTAISGSAWLGAAALGALAGASVGVLIQTWWRRRTSVERRRIPEHWPISARAVANSEELKVWRWLTEAFYDHAVMIKMPVTRFTVPRSKQQGLQWYELLNGVYCTFTIVSKNGRVVACIDVPNRLGISRRNHEVNGSLLKQCGIPYLSANPARLTSVQNIRAELLTERPRPARESGRDSSQEDTREVGQEGAPIRAASDNLRASLMQQRSIRNSDFSQLSQNPVSILDDIGDTMSRFSPNWNDNSFIAPLDSRRAELQ